MITISDPSINASYVARKLAKGRSVQVKQTTFCGNHTLLNIVSSRNGGEAAHKKVAFLFCLQKDGLWHREAWERYLGPHLSTKAIAVVGTPIGVTVSGKLGAHVVSGETSCYYRLALLVKMFEKVLTLPGVERVVVLKEGCVPVVQFPSLYESLLNTSKSFVEEWMLYPTDLDTRFMPVEEKYREKYPCVVYKKHAPFCCLTKEHVHTLLKHRPALHFFAKMPHGDEHYLAILWASGNSKNVLQRVVTWSSWNSATAAYVEKYKHYRALFTGSKNHKKHVRDQKRKELTDAMTEPVPIARLTEEIVQNCCRMQAFFCHKVGKDVNVIQWMKQQTLV